MPLWHAKQRKGFSRRLHQGITLIEVLVSAALLIVGIAAVMGVSNLVQRIERISQLSLTADNLAQDLLEKVSLERCIWNQSLQACHNLTAKDMGAFSLWVGPNGEVKYTKEDAQEGSVEFEARFDVHTTSGCLSGISNANCMATTDNTSAWGLDRKLFEEGVGNLHNVRVTVSYANPFNREVRFVSYQTRVAP